MAQLTRKDTNETIEIPDDLYYNDDLSWSKVVGNQRYATNGKLIVRENVRQAGRPVVLKAPDNLAWMSRAKVKQLLDWSEVLGLEMMYQYTLNNTLVTKKVMFDRTEEPVTATPVKPFNSPHDDDDFRVQIKLREMI